MMPEGFMDGVTRGGEPAITDFYAPGDKWFFLDNFYPQPVMLVPDQDWPRLKWAARTVEHAFQAMKTTDLDVRNGIIHTDHAADAKAWGNTVSKREDWNDIRFELMFRLVNQKFRESMRLRTKLILTGDREIVEGNTWNDRLWGQCPVGVGENWLGCILMRVRQDIIGESR